MSKNISHLPPELLGTCFVHLRDLVIGYDQWKTSPSSWLRIVLVCKRWHDIAVCCPPLWSYIDMLRRSLKMVELLLQRSGAVPLTIKYDNESFIFSERAYTHLEVKIITVLHHSHRIQDLELAMPRPMVDRLVAKYPTTLKLSRLRSLNLISTPSKVDEIGRSPLPFDFDCPKLDTLILSGFAYDHIVSLFHPRLRFLMVLLIEYPALDELLDDIQSMPALEVLTLWWCEGCELVFDGGGRE
ncbi:hypothetical protein QCA50_015539 [Cerrena zonata]|uniref:F-box domain-containing protein n=1 Tax=Cerrena zonata TaxID=2478898 RepID=A0AAW0FVX7_9APHY